MMTLRDGRRLEVSVAGPADGPVLVYLHGTPGSASVPPALRRAVLDRGLRLVSWARPGYASSTRQPGRGVGDVAADLAEVLDGLGVERAHVAGWSGGGPHALACASLAPDRVTGTLVVAGVAPYDADGLEWLAGMGEDNLVEFGAALDGEPALRAFLEAAREEMAGVTGAELSQALASLVSEADLAALEDGELGDGLAESFRDALSAGVDGWLDDDLAFTRPWGFDPADVPGPVHLWQGHQDLMVPPGHGRWLASRLPGARVHLEPEEGHLSLVAGRAAEMVERLLAG